MENTTDDSSFLRAYVVASLVLRKMGLWQQERIKNFASCSDGEGREALNIEKHLTPQILQTSVTISTRLNTVHGGKINNTRRPRITTVSNQRNAALLRGI